jgi:hypothetical protein
MTPSKETTTEEHRDIRAEEIEDALAGNQKEIDASFREAVSKMSDMELVQLHRVAGGTFIYSEVEQALYDTVTAIVIPSKAKRFAAEELRNRRPANRAERRILISQVRREQRRKHRAGLRKRGLFTLGEAA